jgi:hypothetical protein
MKTMGRKPKYPFRQLEVKDSFSVTNANEHSLRMSAYYSGLIHRRRYSVRKVHGSTVLYVHRIK